MNKMSARNPVMVPLNASGVGLLEKRLDANSWLGIGDSVDLNRDFGQEASDSLLLDSVATPHTNHASDPGSVTMALVDSVAINMTRQRGVEDVVTFSDTAHACLCGYRAPTGVETTKASETINIGQPVFPDTSTTVALATANINGVPVFGLPIGLAMTDADVNQSILVATEGSVNQADWTLVTGNTLLTPGAIYVLGGTDGTLTTTAVTTEGHMAIRVGRAITQTKMDIEISDGVII